MRKIVVLICLVCTCALAKSHDPETAVVISQSIKSHQVDRGVMTGTPLIRYSNTVVVETDKERLTLAEMSSYLTGTKSQDVVSPVPLPVNGHVEIKRAGNYIDIRDEDHKKHRFAIIHIEELAPAPEKSSPTMYQQ